MDDETSRLHLTGWPTGAVRRRWLRMWTAMSMLLVLLLAVRPDAWFGAAAAPITMLIALYTPRRDRPIGVMITDRRVAIAQLAGRDRPPIVIEHPAGSITFATLRHDPVTSGPRRAISRVELGGPSGALVALDMERFDPEALVLLLRETGIEVAQHDDGPPATRWWLGRSLLVSVIAIVGVSIVLAAGSALLDRHDAPAALGVTVGAAVLAGAAAAHRALFPRRR